MFQDDRTIFCVLDWANAYPADVFLLSSFSAAQSSVAPAKWADANRLPSSGGLSNTSRLPTVDRLSMSFLDPPGSKGDVS